MHLKKIIIYNPIIIGQLNSAYGIKGYLNITSFTEKIENIFLYQPWFIYHEKWIKLILEKWRLINNKIIIKLNSINDRNNANIIKNKKIFIEYNQLPKLDNNEYYCHELINYNVISMKNYNFGYVYNILKTKANDVLIIRKKINNNFKIKEYLIPFINTLIIKNINCTKKIITVDWDPNFI